MTPSSDTNSDAITLLMETSFVCRVRIVWSEHTTIILKSNY